MATVGDAAALALTSQQATTTTMSHTQTPKAPTLVANSSCNEYTFSHIKQNGKQYTTHAHTQSYFIQQQTVQTGL